MADKQPPIPSNQDVVYLSTDVHKACEACGFAFNDWYDIGNQMQHYIDHGYRVLHVGQETGRDDKDRPYHSTVAVVGMGDQVPS